MKLARTVSGRLTALEFAEASAFLATHGVPVSHFVRSAFLAAFAQVAGRPLGDPLAVFPFATDQEPEA